MPPPPAFPRCSDRLEPQTDLATTTAGWAVLEMFGAEAPRKIAIFDERIERFGRSLDETSALYLSLGLRDALENAPGTFVALARWLTKE